MENLPLIALVGLVIVGLVVLFFELVMFIDVVNSSSLTKEQKILWGLGMLLIHPFVAIVYYFLRFKK